MDTVLPFGLRSASKIFTAVADAVEWIAKANGVEHLFHYLDDFLLVSEPSALAGLHAFLIRSSQKRSWRVQARW